MPFQISIDCIVCNACEPVCPVRAIYLGDDIYEINEKKCIDCKGFYDEPQCVIVCPVDVIFKTDENNETDKS